jgi:hypothetical protein
MTRLLADPSSILDKPYITAEKPTDAPAMTDRRSPRGESIRSRGRRIQVAHHRPVRLLTEEGYPARSPGLIARSTRSLPTARRNDEHRWAAGSPSGQMMGSMVSELPDDQWGNVSDGHLTGPDGRTYRRRGTRSSRKVAQSLIEAGAPLVCYWFGGSQLDWHDGSDAGATWTRLRRDVTTKDAESRRHGRPQWHAGRWEADDGSVVLVLTGTC